MLDPSELNDRTRFMLQRAGLNTDAPISIDRATAAFDPMRGQGGGGRFNRGGEGDARNAGNVANSGDASRENKEDSTPPLVPPFGESTDTASVPGFGEGLVLATASFSGDSQVASTSSGGASSSTTSGSSGGNSSSASSSSGSSDDTKIRGYATSMMKQYDKNGDGVLEKDEWSQMSNGERYDRNHDGKVTLDEIVETLKNWNHDDSTSSASRSDSSGSSAGAGANRSPSSGSTATAASADVAGNPGGRGFGGRRGDSGRGASTASTGTGKHYLTPKERLPEGLPDWFAQDDADGDGQVSMHEFASTWTESKLAEFAKYDLNGDGFITPDEVLKVSPPKK